MNDQYISVLAPDRDILSFEPRLVIALNPLEQEKRVQTDIVLFTFCKDQPEFEVRSFVYFFAEAYELKGVLPLVEGNARRKAVRNTPRLRAEKASRLGGSLGQYSVQRRSARVFELVFFGIANLPMELA